MALLKSINTKARKRFLAAGLGSWAPSLNQMRYRNVIAKDSFTQAQPTRPNYSVLG